MLSQEALAYQAGVSVSTLSRIERGRHTAGWQTLRDLAKALDITTAQLFEKITSIEHAKTNAANWHSGRQIG